MSREVELRRPYGQGFGFSIIGGSNTHLPPMVSALVKDSVSFKDGKIFVGDIIEKVNGINARELPTKSIVDLIKNSEEKISLTLIDDPQAKALARPFLLEKNTLGTVQRSHKPENITLTKKEKFPVYKRTVGSPEYDRLGTDGTFCSTGSLDKCPVDLSVDGKLGEVRRSPLSARERDKEDDLSDRVDFNIIKQSDETTSSNDSDQQEIRVRLDSNPVFGSAPRLHFDTNDEIMRQISGQPFSGQRNTNNRQAPAYGQRYLPAEEQGWNYNQGQPTASNTNSNNRSWNSADNRAGFHRTETNRAERYASDPRIVSTNRTGGNVRFQDTPSHETHGWNRSNHVDVKQQNIPNGISFVASRGAYSEEKLASVSNAQDLRNAYMRHQVALENHKRAGFTHRRHSSNEELPLRGPERSVQSNGPAQFYSTRDALNAKQRDVNSPRSLDTFTDNGYEADLQSSGYGSGFHRTNSLGRAEMYHRYSGNKDFYCVDKTHVNRYANLTSEAEMRNQAEARPVLSQAVQERLREIPISTMANRSNGMNYQTAYQGGHFSPNQTSLLNNDQRMNNGIVMRESEDGVAHSRYDHGKSLAVSAPDDYFPTHTSPEQIPNAYGRRSDSYLSGTSPRSTMSEEKGHERMLQNSIPNDLESFDPIDLATRLYTLDGFTRDDVAPFLGKNTEFSKQVCREYMKFMNFEGYPLDEALRILLRKFPLTGETQERERILIQFSKRYFECNKPVYGSEDSVHTLTCALMLLNTDLHGQNIGTKMTLNEFVNNLSGMDDGTDFSREVLKTLYQSIKNNEIQYASSQVPKEIKPASKMTRKPSSSGNPFIELKADDDAVVMREGMMYRKCIMETDGKRLPAMKRGWKMFYCMLKGLVLFLYKPDKSSSEQCIGLHHSLAGFATEYKKRPFVVKVITADWRVFMFQARSKTDVQDWVDAINLSAAALSSPPLPAPCSSSKQFSRPVMPVSVTRLTLEEQIRRHQDRTEMIDKEMQEHREIQPHENSKEFKEWENKMHYLEFEYKRFSAYAKVLCTPRLKDSLDFLLSKRLKNPISASKTDKAVIRQSHRSNSLNDVGTASSPAQRRRARQSYLRAVYS